MLGSGGSCCASGMYVAGWLSFVILLVPDTVVCSWVSRSTSSEVIQSF